MSRLEWQVAEEGDVLPPLLPDDELSRRRVRWWWFAALLLLLALLAGTVRWRMARQDAALRADLTEAIVQEEQARLFGLREQASRLAVQDAPEAWFERYRSTFLTPEESRPVDVDVDEVVLEGERAVVTTQVGESRQLRAYELQGGQWRRAPLATDLWGDVQELYLAGAPGLRLLFHERDEQFARELAGELSSLRESWPFSTAFPPDYEVRITPRELDVAMPEQSEGSALIVNSSLLVLPTGPWGGESEVRLAVAQAILATQRPSGDHEYRLSGAAHLTGAAHAVMAMHWALSAEEQERVRERWRASGRNETLSPFFDGATHPQQRTVDLWNPNRLEAIALLAADYLYLIEGPEVLAALVREAASAATWDAAMLDAVGRFTAEVDREVAAYAREGIEVARRLRETRPRPVDVPALPLRVERLEKHPEEAGLFNAWVPGATRPLLVERENPDVVTSTGMVLPSTCLEIYRPLSIEGDWLEVGERLAARRVVVEEMAPPIALKGVASPANTVAYLLETSGGVYGTGKANALLALTDDGALAHLLDVRAFSTIVPFRVGDDGATRFLLEYQTLTCGHSWLFVYDPIEGSVRLWMMPPSAGQGIYQVIPRQARGDVVVLSGTFQSAGTTHPYLTLRVGEAGLAGQEGQVPNGVEIVGWDDNAERFVGVDFTAGEMATIDPETGAIKERVPLSGLSAFPLWNLRKRRLLFMSIEARSPDVPSGDRASVLSGASLWYYDLDTREKVLLVDRMGESEHFYWPTAFAGDRLLLLAEPLPDQPDVVVLLLVDPDDLTQPAVVYRGIEGRVSTQSLLCRGDTVLFTLYLEGAPEIHLWHPAEGTRTLFAGTDQSMRLFACR